VKLWWVCLPRTSFDILYRLPRARSNGYVDDVRPVIVGISNVFQFRDNLSPNFKNMLAEKEFLILPYDATQLRSILTPHVEKAFHDDVLVEDVVPLYAAFAAQDTGSPRQAIRLLREAGELPQVANFDTVTEGRPGRPRRARKEPILRGDAGTHDPGICDYHLIEGGGSYSLPFHSGQF